MILDTFALEEIASRNNIDANLFLPFLVHRLMPLATERAAVFTVILENLSSTQETRQLHLTWRESSEPLKMPPVQSSVITEWAACGIACAVLPLYTKCGILGVAQIGSGFDYWVGQEKSELGLEVSGTLLADIRQRQRLKIRQLSQSPHQVPGYVCITKFRSRQILLSFHE